MPAHIIEKHNGKIHDSMWLEDPDTYLKWHGFDTTVPITVPTTLYNELWDITVEVYPSSEPLGRDSEESRAARDGRTFMGFMTNGIPPNAKLTQCTEPDTYMDSLFKEMLTITWFSFGLGKVRWHCTVTQGATFTCCCVEQSNLPFRLGWAWSLPPTLISSENKEQ